MAVGSSAGCESDDGADRERGEEVRRCQQLLPAEQKLRNAQLDMGPQ